MKTTQIDPRRGWLPRAALVSVCMVGSFCIPLSAQAEEARLGSVTFWGAAADGAENTAAAIGPSLLRPPASWSWETAAPKLDFATGVEKSFKSGLSLNAGLSTAHAAEDARGDTIDYRDYFLGMRYGAVDTKVWYLDDATGSAQSTVYYDAGWQQPVSDKLSMSLRLGQYDQSAYNLPGYETAPSLSLGANTTMGGYGLGLRVIDGGGRLFGGEQDLRLMGSISKPLK